MRSDKEMDWKTLSSEYLIRRPWLTARRDEVELPNGQRIDEYYVLEYPNWVNVVAITTRGEIILERQWRQALGEMSTEIVAGVIEPGEPPLDAAKRELQEETGYTGGTWQELMVTAPNSSTMNNRCYSFLALGVDRTAETHFDATEDLEVMLKPQTEVLEMLKRGEFKQAMMVAPLWKYFFEHREEQTQK